MNLISWFSKMTFLFCILNSTLSQAETPPKVLKIGTSQELDTLNALGSSMLIGNYIYDMVNRNLVALDADMNWVPQLAESIPQLKDKTARIIMKDKQKKIVSDWVIRSSARWGDGADLTCEDFLFSRELALHPNTTVINRTAYEDIEEIQCDAKNPKKLTLLHRTATWDFYKLAFLYVLPKHLEKPIFDQFSSTKEGYDKNSLYNKNPTNPGLYNGPFLVTEVKPGSHLILKTNPKFFGSPAKISSIIIKVIPDTNAIIAHLQTGEINMISPVGIGMDQALMLEKKIVSEKLNSRLVLTPGFTYEHIDLNMDNPILKDVRVRQALILAIDRPQMVQAFFEGRQKVAAHFLSEKDPFFQKLPGKMKEIVKPSTTLAAQTLEKAGWKRADDGYRYKKGVKLSLEFATTAGNKIRETAQVYIQDQLKKVGIETVVKNSTARVFFSEMLKKRKFEGMAMFAWTFLPEVSPSKFYSSTEIPSDKNAWTGRNYGGWINKKVDASLKTLETSFDPDERQKMVNTIVENYVNDRPTIPLFYRADITAVPTSMENYRPTGNQQLETLFVENWKF